MEAEKKIILKAKKDIKAFDYLYRKYFPKINNFVFHRVNGEAEKNDIVSNVFFKAMKRLPLYRFKDSSHARGRSFGNCVFSSWLFKIAVNEINQYYRNVKREEKIRNDLKNNPQPVSQTHNETDFDIVKEKMRSLSLYEQNLISLRFFEKMKNKEIAQILGKKESTIKVQVHRTINKLRNILGGEINHEEF